MTYNIVILSDAPTINFEELKKIKILRFAFWNNAKFRGIQQLKRDVETSFEMHQVEEFTANAKYSDSKNFIVLEA